MEANVSVSSERGVSLSFRGNLLIYKQKKMFLITKLPRVVQRCNERLSGILRDFQLRIINIKIFSTRQTGNKHLLSAGNDLDSNISLFFELDSSM